LHFSMLVYLIVHLIALYHVTVGSVSSPVRIFMTFSSFITFLSGVIDVETASPLLVDS
jgi:hypothetical protein